MEHSISDLEIIRKVKNGDVQLFSELVRKYQDKVLRLCYSIVGESSAEDAAQEIFIKIFESLDKFKELSAFSTWLYRIAYNHCLNILSKRKSEKTISLDSFDTEIIPSLLSEPRMETEEAKELVKKALQLLSPADRLILTLREMEGLSYKELAELLEISMDAVKGRLFRARKALVVALKEIGF